MKKKGKRKKGWEKKCKGKKGGREGKESKKERKEGKKRREERNKEIKFYRDEINLTGKKLGCPASNQLLLRP